MTSLSTRTPSQSKITAITRSLGRLAGLEETVHALERAQDIFRGIGIRDAQIALAQDAEVRSADQGHAGLIQQRIGQGLGLPSCLLDVGEGIKGALGRDAGDARQLVEAFHYQLAALVELGT